MTAVAVPALGRRRPPSWRVVRMLLWRDIFVTGRELTAFLAQVVLQPLFILFVYGKVLGDLGYTEGGFASVLLPGIIALNGFLAALQNTALPLVLDFSFSREIEDRLLAPVPISAVAIEKMLFGAARGFIAAAVMVPFGILLLPQAPIRARELAPAAGMVALGALAGAAIGMTLGTLVEARRINVLFAVILTPVMFTGATQFPLSGLSHLRWFQVVCAANPLTYVSEGVRGVLVPSVPHVPIWLDALLTLFAIGVFGAIAIFGFRRRALG